MTKLVISTVGTSVLTNQIDPDIDDNDWYERLQQTANYTDNEIQHDPVIKKIISELKERAEQELSSSDTDKIRKASAELNGIYGLYNEQIEQGIPDMHLLITTDTAQGRVAAEIVESFLKRKGLTNISIHAQSGLSTASSEIFVEGMAKLIPSMQETIKKCKDCQYTICFNLVGGFKALQGYFNTIGMFHADKIIYVFEGSNTLITIPKLPVKVDVEKVAPYKVQLAMMSAGEISTSSEKAKEVPQDWVLLDGNEITLSIWGQLIWNQCKSEILSGELLKFPKLEYAGSFKDDYKNQTDLKKRAELQETLAKVAYLLAKNKDGVGELKKDGGLQFERYTNTSIDHFRDTLGLRVSCKVLEKSSLSLRYYGTHNHVERSEGIKGR
ncbi:putative CRISPR-associated protein [Limnofasciculus baicalensis]|uniref:CRISPR-associated protein n=1 Tax=Limnofasciculus baicalensis BBK-W-15 TaxID=2699891 RepID=A0AAE3GQA2_9CYAN|nr:putative CRISPR-associated protein [Limnofasciculus baicalensis]MCP2727928.1 putative CRISPR-associated protein [Limnofasciculus baicalensis BBK-W-15]